MKVLLDTHVLLWWRQDSKRISDRVRRIFEDRRSELLWSAASTWELAVKARTRKLALPDV